jgi:hypothetical protein
MAGDSVDPDLDGDVDGARAGASGLSPGIVKKAGNPSEPVTAGAGEGEAVEVSTAPARLKCKVFVSFA